MSAPISRDEWLAAAEEAERALRPPRDPNWLTLHEIADLLKVHYNTARRTLCAMLAAGTAERRILLVESIDGKRRPTPCWRLIRKQPEATKVRGKKAR
jgi:predicted ArsR family transcriptional regulator